MKRISVFVIVTLTACGGSGAALSASVFPGDTRVTGRRLEGLAREFEGTITCTPDDTIEIRGLAPQVYHVEGCSSSADYMLQCRPRASGGYGPSETCSWQMFTDVNTIAARDFGCDRDAIDVQPVGADGRLASGCGYRATYVLQCAGAGCQWTLAGRIEGSSTSGGDQGTGSGPYTY
jgi:hypothetical protein